MATVKFFLRLNPEVRGIWSLWEQIFSFFSRWITVPILLSIKWQFKYKISGRECSIFRMKFTWYKELWCSWGPFQLHEAVRQAGFSSRIPPAVVCRSTIYGGFMGSLCKEVGACVAVGEESSIHWTVFLLCKWVASRGALRCGTGEKQGSQVLLLSGCSQLLEWPFGHHAARMYKICVWSWSDPWQSWSDPWQSIRFGRWRNWSTAIFLKHPLWNSNNPRSPDSQNESISVSQRH